MPDTPGMPFAIPLDIASALPLGVCLSLLFCLLSASAGVHLSPNLLLSPSLVPCSVPVESESVREKLLGKMQEKMQKRPAGLPVPKRIPRRAEWLSARLSGRDIAILETLRMLHFASGDQLQRVHFHGLSQAFTVRKRVMRRLVSWRAVTYFQGPAQSGSSPRVYALDPAARLLMKMRDGDDASLSDKRTKVLPGRLVPHSLAVSEVYVRLHEMALNGRLGMRYTTEPESWWSSLRPDAHLILTHRKGTDHWWLEIDMGSESITVIKSKMSAYMAFIQSGAEMPYQVIPKVLFIVPDASRRAAFQRLIDTYGAFGHQILSVTTMTHAASFLTTAERV